MATVVADTSDASPPPTRTTAMAAATLDEIVRRNQRLLHHILKRFAYASEPYEDLVQVANLGLIKAAQRFDVGRGARF